MVYREMLQKKVVATILIICAGSVTLQAQTYYTQIGTDPTWDKILADKAIPIGSNSTGGYLGSKIVVNRSEVEVGPNANRPIEQAINIHTLGNSVIPRADFHKWTRWYQEDGNTQVFRLFNGETNVRNTRPNSARIEAFSQHKWKKGTQWHEWVGTYTLVKASGAIFQIKAPGPVDWALMITVGSQTSIKLQYRDKTTKTVNSGRRFDLRIRDNGHNFEVYVNGKLEMSGNYDRKGLESNFRWGMYVGAQRKATESIMMVTGATINPSSAKPLSLDGQVLFSNPQGKTRLTMAMDGRIFTLNREAPWEVVSLQGKTLRQGYGNSFNLGGAAPGLYWVKLGDTGERLRLGP